MLDAVRASIFLNDDLHKMIYIKHRKSTFTLRSCFPEKSAISSRTMWNLLHISARSSN